MQLSQDCCSPDGAVMKGCAQWQNEDYWGETEVLRKKAALLPLCPALISLEVSWD
jgi:hypothetical protein